LPGLALLAGAAPAARAQAASSDPVEELRQALLVPPGPEKGDLLRYREESLQRRIDALKTLGDLRRALMLTEWKDGAGASGRLQAIDQAKRALVGERFQKGVHAVVEKGEVISRLAAAQLLGEMGINVRAVDPKDFTGFTRSLTPQLVTLTHDKDGAVRAAAARALGKINADPKVAVAALKEMLESDGTPQRRAASEGLLDLVRTMGQLQRKGKQQTGVMANDSDVLAAAREVTANIGPGLSDKDTQVRRNSLEALHQAAYALSELVSDPQKSELLPPRDRKWTPAEEQFVRKLRKEVEVERAFLQPLIDAFQGHGERIAATLTDPDPEVRLTARHALEMISNARLRLLRRVRSIPEMPIQAQPEAGDTVPVVQKDEKDQKDGPKDDPLGEVLRPSLLVMAKGLQDPDVRVRRAAVDFLEVLEDAALPALPALVKALQDPDRFVRWAVVRTLGRIGRSAAKEASPGLGKLLSDPDLDVRLMATNTLDRYGPAAVAAVPALIEATRSGDSEIRIAAMRTLTSVGPANSRQAIPALIEGLSNADARVRRAAAEALAQHGPEASSAVPALRRALQDDDAEVRRAASEALLAIVPPG
jgi:HEAT repeat protein